MTTVWVLEPEWTKPPLSMNDRGAHWAPKAKKVAAVRAWASEAATAALIPPLGHCTVQMVWVVPDKRRRDEENPVETLKPFCDGIVDAGLVPDDIPLWMTKFMPVIEYRKGLSAVRFEISGEPLS